MLHKSVLPLSVVYYVTLDCIIVEYSVLCYTRVYNGGCIVLCYIVVYHVGVKCIMLL